MSRRKECEMCGTVFVCEGNLKCWCARVEVPKRRRKEISTLADDCVCRVCLTKSDEASKSLARS